MPSSYLDANGKPLSSQEIQTIYNKIGIKGLGLNDNIKKTSEGNIIWSMGYHPTKGDDYKIKIKENEYNFNTLDPSPKLVFDKEGKLTDGTTFVVGRGGGNFYITGYKQPLSEGTKVSFENGKVLIKYPENSRIELPEVVDQKEAEKTVIEFSSEKGFKLPNDYLFDKTLRLKNGIFSFSAETGNIDGIEFKNINLKDVGIYFDGKEHDYAGSYLSIGKNQIILGANNNEEGVLVRFGKGNEFFNKIKENELVMLQAGKNKDNLGDAGTGIIKITKEGNSPAIIETFGSFRSYNGNVIHAGSITDGKFKMHSWNSKELQTMDHYPIELYNYDQKGDFVIKSENQGYKWVLDKDNVFQLVLTEKRIASDGTSEQNQQTNSNKEEPRVEFVLEESSTPSGEGGNSGNGKIEENPTPLFEKYGNNQYNSALDDLKDHYGGKFDSSEDGPSGDLGHGTTHGINEDIREEVNRIKQGYIMRNGQRVLDSKGFATLGAYQGFYLLNGDKAILKEPEFDFKEIKEFVPNQLIGSGSYNLYIQNGNNAGNRYHPLYVFDELTAYTNGAIVSAETGRRKSVEVIDFMSYSVSLGQAVQQKDPTYWGNENGVQFKNFLGYSLQRAVDAQGKQIGNPELAKQSFYERTDEKGRQFLIQTYGPEWTKRVFGF